MWGLGIGEGVWYEKVQDRREWYEAYSEGVVQHQNQGDTRKRGQ